MQVDPVTHVIVSERRGNGSAKHRGEQRRGHDRSRHGEGRQRRAAATGRFECPDRARHIRRKHDEGEQQIDPHGDVTDARAHVPLQPPPHERLVELVRGEQQGQGREGDVVISVTHVAQRVESDDRERGSAEEVCLGREAHCSTVQAARLAERVSVDRCAGTVRSALSRTLRIEVPVAGDLVLW